MSLQGAALDVRAELATAVEAGRIPSKLIPVAKQLLARLARPVTIGIGGLPGSGKSTLLNLLAGSQVLSDEVRLPTTELSYGEHPATLCTLPDGSTTEFDHADVRQIAALSPIFVQIRLPLPALTRVSLLEIVASDDETEQHRALSWMSKRSDIAIWCTRVFTAAEQLLWSDMPETIRDHAFLLITKADLLRCNGTLQDTLEAITAGSSDLFTHVLPIETTKAIAARRPDGAVDKDRMRESGGVALVSAILRTVDMGLQAAMDRAELLMRQSDMATAAEAREPTARSPQTPAPPATTPTHTPATAPAAEASPAEPAESGAVENVEVEPGEDADVSDPDQAPALSTEIRKIYENAVDYLARQGEEIAYDVAELEAGAPAVVMARAVENVQWLSDYLEEADAANHPTLDRAREVALDASDLVQLMQMENRDSAAIEAVSLVVQLKRELQMELAA